MTDGDVLVGMRDGVVAGRDIPQNQLETVLGIVASDCMLLGEDMRRSSVKEYAETMSERYWGASKADKGPVRLTSSLR